MLLDHIDAPPPVLSYLCNKYNIHNIPIAGELRAAEIEEVGRGSCGCVLCIGYVYRELCLSCVTYCTYSLREAYQGL